MCGTDLFLDEHSKLTSNITHLNLDIELDLILCTTVVRSQQANDAPNWFFVSPQTDFLPGVFTVYRQSESKTNKQANKQQKKKANKKNQQSIAFKCLMRIRKLEQ